MNQAVSFGLLGVGGILLTKAITGSSFADVVKGHPAPVPTSGSKLNVAGVGAAAVGATTTGLNFPSGSKTGKVSWFGGPNDPSAGSTTASGKSTSVPGIAVYSQATLGGYWLLQAPNGRQFVAQQTDIGPAPWTGRLFDFTYSLLSRIGYTEGSFPTDSQVTGSYLGKTVPSQYASLLIS